MDLVNLMSRMTLDGLPDERPSPPPPRSNILVRSIEMLLVVLVGGLFIGGMCIGLGVIAALVYYQYYKTLICYAVFYAFDWQTSSNGGRRSNWLRSFPIWNFFCDYFPVRLVKTAPIKPNRNYIFGYHPHGIISCGAFATFATEGNGFSRLFPGITPSLMTLGLNFIWPLTRLYFLFMGMVDVSRRSIMSVCGGPPSGKAAVIVVGGAAESMMANPSLADLILRMRKGFVKLAIKCGASLVPCYAFQENDLFTQSAPAFIKKIQQFIKARTGVAPPLAFGVFNLPLPFRAPVNVVIGKPIHVEKDANPSQELIDRVHGAYVNALQQLYNNNKGQYSEHPSTPIQFL